MKYIHTLFAIFFISFAETKSIMNRPTTVCGLFIKLLGVNVTQNGFMTIGKNIWSLLLTFLFISVVIVSASYSAEKPEIFVQVGHSSGVTSVAFSSDGRYALSGSGDKTLKLWDVSTGREIRAFRGHLEGISSVAFSPNGRYVLSGSGDKTLKLWDVSTGREIRAFRGHLEGISSVAFSPNGRYTLSGSWDNTMKLWDLSTGKEIRTFHGHLEKVSSVAFSPNGRYAISGSMDSTIKLWEISTGKNIRTFKRHAMSVTSVAFSPDGQYAISGSWFGEAPMLWDVSTGKNIREFKGEARGVQSIAFSPNGRYALSGSDDIIIAFTPQGQQYLSRSEKKTIKLWDVSTGREIRAFQGHSSVVTSVAFSADGRYAISGSLDKTIKLWDVATGTEVRTFQGYSYSIDSVAISPNGQYAFSGYRNSLNLWELVAGRKIKTFQNDSGAFQSTIFSPDGLYALSVTGHTLNLLDVATGKEKRIFRGHLDNVQSMTFSLDGQRALSGSWDNTMKLWDVSTGKEIRTFHGHLEAVSSVAFSPDGRYAISGSMDDSIKLWEISTGKNVRSFTGHSGGVESVAISPDGRYVLSGSWDSTMKLWDVSTGKNIRTFEGHSREIFFIAFIKNGKYAISASNDAIKIWDVSTGREIKTFRDHSAEISSVGFTLDSKYILTGNKNGEMKFWDVHEGIEICSMITIANGEWIAITPEGYFNVSPNGAKYVNVRVGNKVYSVDQFYSQFYRPDIVQLALAGKAVPKEKKSFYQIATKSPAPNVEIISPKDGETSSKENIQLTVKIIDNGGGISDINIHLNGSLVANELRGLEIKSKENAREKRVNFDISLVEGNNDIRVAAFNKEGSMESQPVSITVVAKITSVKPNLHALVIGINQYKNESISLKYAVTDAKEFTETLKKSASPLFGSVNVALLTSGEQTSKDNIKKAFDQISTKIKPNDVFVFYNASHGVIDIVDDQEQYYLLTSNVLFLSSKHIGKDALSQKELAGLIGNIPAQKKFIILDTCHAGRAGKEITVALLQQTRGLTESTAVKLLQRAIGATVFSASSDSQQAMEGYKGHGLFTYVLNEGLKGKADVKKDGFITINALGEYVEEEVVKLSKEIFKRQQTPTIQIGVNFPVGKVK